MIDRLLDSFLGVLAPHECLGCSREGTLLCKDCAGHLPAAPERCYRCQRPSPGSLTCAQCLRASRLRRAGAATVYEGMGKELVARLKFAGAQSAVRQMAGLLTLLAEEAPYSLVIPVPTASSRVRRRGYDQACLLARELSRRSRLPYLDCLLRSGQTHQVGASRDRRLSQIHDSFRVARLSGVRGRRVLLVDDVLTTGATLEAAASALHRAGAARIEAVTFCAARPWL